MAASTEIRAIELQSSGAVLIGGDFDAIGIQGRTNIARLLGNNGAVDSTFNGSATFANSLVRDLEVDATGRILMVGDFTTVNGFTRNRIARLATDGTLDLGFDPGVALDASSLSVASAPTGKVIAGGTFQTFDGIARRHVVQLNGDPGVIQVANASATILERGDSPPSAPRVSIPLQRFSGISGSITVGFSVVAGTATSDVDFVQTNGTVTFGPGVTSTNVDLLILNDVAIEGDETFNFVLTNAVGGLLGASTNTQVTISDDDSAIQFAVVAANFFENFGTSSNETTANLDLTVTRTGVVDTEVSVPYQTIEGTASNGVDFVMASNVVVFGTNVTSTNITISIVNDRIQELSEVFFVTLGTPTGEAALAANTNLTLTIDDNDSTISLNPAFTNVLEGVTNMLAPSGTLAFTVSRVGFTDNEVSVSFGGVDGTATSPMDYQFANNVVTLRTGVFSTNIFVEVINDQLPESSETFSVNLSNIVGQASFGSQISSAVTLTDNDSFFGFSSTNTTLVESNRNLVLQIVRTGFTNVPVTVSVQTRPGSAVAVEDYRSVTTNITFQPGETVRDARIEVINDKIVEPDEQFEIFIAPPGSGQQGSLTGNSNNIVTILDDDSLVEFEVAATNVTENAGSIVLNVTRTGNTGNAVVVGYATFFATAQPGDDFVATNDSLVFGPGVNSQSITVGILNDTQVEISETFNVRLLAVQQGEAALGSRDAATITIVDDDSEIRFSALSYTVVERSGGVDVHVLREGTTAAPVSVEYAYRAGSAASIVDFTNAPGTLNFGVGVTNQTIRVGIVNDQRIDQLATNVETFEIFLTNVVGEADVVSNLSVATIVIEDDDSRLEFVSTNLTVYESGGSVSLSIKRDLVFDTTISHQVIFADGTATNNTDYTGVIQTVAFAPNETNKTVVVPILNDKLLETNKTFTVLLVNAVGDAAIGVRSNATVTILDDDSQISLPQSFIPLPESSVPVDFVITREGATDLPVTVELAGVPATNNPAHAGSDYVDFGTTLTFGPGETTKQVTLTLNNDTVEEGNETFSMALQNFGGEAVPGALSNMVVQINDDDFRIIQPGGYQLISESYVPANGGIDPFETNSVAIALKNIGNVDATNVTARLLEQGGVILNPDTNTYPVSLSYPDIQAGGAAVSRTFTFRADRVRQIRAVLELSDQNGVFAYVTNLVDVGRVNTFTNADPSGSRLILIPATVSVPSFGPSGPYPSSIDVSGITGVVNRVRVHLNGLTHTYPGDIDVLLVGPGGQKVLLMADTGRDTPVNEVNLTFDADATQSLPQFAPLSSGTFRPTDYGPVDSFDAPAPQGPYTTDLTEFRGRSPNGVWSLYIYDDTDFNFGRLSAGWSLN